MKNNFYKTFYLFVLFLALAACKKGGDDQAPTPAVVNTAVTIDNYNQITLGMTYTQVVTLLGQGTLASTNNYSWSADDTNSIVIYVTFSNNVVTAKSQMGLASTGSTGTGGTGTGTGGTGGTGTGSTGSTGGGCPATYNGHTVYTGPRGGCYYINKNGNKTYI